MITIDTQNKSLGRTASAVAKILMGKDTVGYQPHMPGGAKVTLINVSKAKIDAKKLSTTFYERYSGYPGGLTKERMDMLAARKGYAEIFSLAIRGMLPINKHRDILMKNLTITE